MRIVIALLLAVAAGPALASLPGQPLDCSDWVAVNPSFRCVEVIPPGQCGITCRGNPSDFDGYYTDYAGSPRTVDNEGHVLYAMKASLEDTRCTEHALVVYIGSPWEILGFICDRWNGNLGVNDLLAPASYRGSTRDPGYGTFPVLFDPVQGRLLIPILRRCGADPCPYEQASSLIGIEGFTPLLEVMQGYVPEQRSLGFSTPPIPEGLRAADRFDTYWGSLTKPLDLTEAHPLQCAYPDHQPQVGDYLSFPDAAPTPAPGQAVYYLTSVTYLGQTRAGRKAIDGRLSGRDASRLPACVVEAEATR